MSKFELVKEKCRKLGGKLYQDFLDAGYQEWPPSSFSGNDVTLAKFIKDSTGRKLFNLAVRVWDHTKYPYGRFGIDAEVQYNSHFLERTFNVELLQVVSLKETEDFFTKLYYSMECRPYEQDE